MSQSLTVPASDGLLRGRLVPVSRLGDAALWLAVFLGGFVIAEPAPYELLMAVLLAVWLFAGLKFRREIGPLIVLLLMFMAGGIMAVPFARDLPSGTMHMAVSAFLAATAMFYAALITERPDRIHIIERAYIASAFFCAILGIVGFFNLFPGAEVFTLNDRAKGTFQDPNVFGPFLLLPALLLMRRVMTGPMRTWGATLIVLPVLILGVFLSFSRGAWGMLAVAGLIVYLLVLINEQRADRRLRLVLLAVGGVVAVMALLLVALSIDQVADMFEQRAKLVQPYDGARLGRFARYSLGFEMAMERPLGLGPLEFNKYFPEDEHNVYMKAFTAYGWLGGIAWPVLMIWTLVALGRQMFRNHPWSYFAQCLFAVLIAHILVGIVIDIDRWRHLYLLLGLSWGLIAASRLSDRRLGIGLKPASSTVPARAPAAPAARAPARP
ncbi:O-antigen ligase family protein [Pannonibacter tanglangensis]|nr:O-antigen ligase family protein [Pannonibacter sp. XCT-34]